MNATPEYLDPYRRAVEKDGAGFESQLWLSRSAQRSRFRVLANALGKNPGVVADLGCGIGDFLVYLHERSRLPTRYIGVEGIEDMAALGRRRADELDIGSASFVTHDFVADADLPGQLVRDAQADAFVFSGSLNTLQEDGARAVLDRFYSALERAGRGRLVFNFLSLRHNKDRTPAMAPAVRFDPVSMLEWALDRTPMVRLRHDYLNGHDTTIVMRVPQES